ncbi:MAG: glycosyltransferase family 2 protein [Nitrospirae bacterium]|nr:glycosyltransferase family 2 protein [Nitrospirota bacterium]
MLISICIPHYNRAEYLLVVLDSIRRQDYVAVEVIISDDASTDESEHVIPAYIASLKGQCPVRFRYIRQPKNLGYDANLRASWGAAEGEYLFTLGNDDALSSENALSQLATFLKQLNLPDAVFVNCHPYGAAGPVARRAQRTAVIGSGPNVAVRTFRSFSVVCGVVLKNSSFKRFDTNKCDGSIYVQIYIAARIIAAGGTLASIAEPLVAMNVQIPGKTVNSYLDVLERDNCKLTPKTGGLDQVGRVACDAILPFVQAHERGRYIFSIYCQILCFSYPYWLYDYRKNGVYKAAVNMALGCFPPRLIKISRVSLSTWIGLLAVYLVTTSAGLLVPTGILEKLKMPLYRLSKALGYLGKKSLSPSCE